MKNSPKNRFASFQEEWASKRFSDAFTVLPNNTLSRAELNDEAGAVKNIHYGDVLIKYGEYLDAGKTDIPFIASEELEEKWKSAALQNGDVVMADTAEDTTAGKCTELGNIRSDTIVSGLHTIPLRPQSKFSEGYLGHYMNSDAYHDQLIPLMQGTKVTSISKTYLADTELRFPPDSAEQAQIAQLLYSLDQMITSQQRKCEKLIALKAACLEKMFPKEGSKVPEMRFAGFTGDWEQRKLSVLCSEFKSGDFIRAEEIVDLGDYPVYGGNGLRGYTDRYNHDGDFALIGRQGALCGNMNYSSGKAYFTEHAVAVKANEYNDTRFLFYCFGRMNLGQYSGQSAQPGLAVSKLVGLETMVPSKPEQELISASLSVLDDLITLHQHKLKKLLQFKQAMMHNMFV